VNIFGAEQSLSARSKSIVFDAERPQLSIDFNRMNHRGANLVLKRRHVFGDKKLSLNRTGKRTSWKSGSMLGPRPLVSRFSAPADRVACNTSMLF
jgi:hypothetical protein